MHELSCPAISRLFLFSFSRFHLCAPYLVGSACCKKFFYEASVLTNRSCRTCFWGLFHYAFCRLTTVQHAKLLVTIFSLFIVPRSSLPSLLFIYLHPRCLFPIHSLGFRTDFLMSQVSYQVDSYYLYRLFSAILSHTCSLLSLDRLRQAACAKFHLRSFLPRAVWDSFVEASCLYSF